MAVPISPDVDNYFIGAGYLTFTPDGGSPRDLGNVVEVELTPSVDKKEHKTKRVGSAKTDVTRFTNQTVQIRLVLDELTGKNMQLMMMSDDPNVNTDGSETIRIMKESVIAGSLAFTATNDVGNQIDILMPSVSFGPSGSFSPIVSGDDEFQTIEMTGDLLAVTYTDGTSDFGTMTVRPQV